MRKNTNKILKKRCYPFKFKTHAEKSDKIAEVII